MIEFVFRFPLGASQHEPLLSSLIDLLLNFARLSLHGDLVGGQLGLSRFGLFDRVGRGCSRLYFLKVKFALSMRFAMP